MDKSINKRDRFRGCIIGGAAGDALGYAVEFMSEPLLFQTYGNRGITQYQLVDGKARFSDDTQMTLFTANALLNGAEKVLCGQTRYGFIPYLASAYRAWFKTQTSEFAYDPENRFWIQNVKELYAWRAPGNTCLDAIRDGCCGSVEEPVNDSKGCGGVMRVAPIGLFLGGGKMPIAEVDMLGATSAALTHGHEMGYIPAAMLVHIIAILAHRSEISLKEAVLEALDSVETLFEGAKHLPAFAALIRKAVALSETKKFTILAIHDLGEGWCGDEALAIAIYCALKYQDDFDKAIMAAVNHRGDSDSTGAITGNILGAYMGVFGIPSKYTENLELISVLEEVADDLYDCAKVEGDMSQGGIPCWKEKYCYITYGEEWAE